MPVILGGIVSLIGLCSGSVCGDDTSSLQSKLDMARRTCSREQYYTGTREFTQAGKTAGQRRPKIYIYTYIYIDLYIYIYIYMYIHICVWVCFSLISSDSLIRFGSGRLCNEIWVFCIPWLQRGVQENPYEKD